MEKIVVLDILQKGSPVPSPKLLEAFRRRRLFIARGNYLQHNIIFGLHKEKLFLVAAIAPENLKLDIGDEVELSKLAGWVRIDIDALSSLARAELEHAVERIIDSEEKRFVEFFNKAGPITTRLHSLELLPGIGKKHMWDIIEQRRKPFESFEDIKRRVPLLPEPKKIIKERILKELEGNEKYYIFVLPPRKPRFR